jgi:hypothetical protein
LLARIFLQRTFNAPAMDGTHIKPGSVLSELPLVI